MYFAVNLKLGQISMLTSFSRLSFNSTLQIVRRLQISSFVLIQFFFSVKASIIRQPLPSSNEGSFITSQYSNERNENFQDGNNIFVQIM